MFSLVWEGACRGIAQAQTDPMPRCLLGPPAPSALGMPDRCWRYGPLGPECRYHRRRRMVSWSVQMPQRISLWNVKRSSPSSLLPRSARPAELPVKLPAHRPLYVTGARRRSATGGAPRLCNLPESYDGRQDHSGGGSYTADRPAYNRFGTATQLPTPSHTVLCGGLLDV